MNRIRLLSEQVANQIAAGEVVERPASVVKELVENALDAEAGRVTVEIQAGGRSLIRVIDDGIGMNRDDALLCLERHATSKIRRAEDLMEIGSFGFRGEALPSIASVSRFTLVTCERGAENPEATEISVQGGRIAHVRSAAGAPGTQVEVRQLFYNLPARRKFLRSEETERSHIQHYLTLAALGSPQVGFTFISDQRLVWQLPPVAVRPGSNGPLLALEERMDALRGKTSLRMLPLDFTSRVTRIERPEADDATSGPEAEVTEIRIWGLIGAPGVARATREDQHVFVNRRPVENRGVNHALLEGYHTALMKGRYPVCTLFLEIPPGEVDVNIHPAKREVKFRHEQQVRRAVTQAVRQTLLRFHGGPIPTPTGTQPGSSANPPPTVLTIGQAPEPPAAPRHSQTPLDLSPSHPAPHETSSASPILPSAPSPLPHTGRPDFPQPPAAFPRPGDPPRSVPASETGPVSDPRPPGSPLPLLQVPLRLVGVVGRLYVVFESDRGLVLMDQHAAHERVLFEQMLDRMEQNQAPSQRLLLPETLELEARDAAFLAQHLDVLGRMGVGLSEFGERTFLLDALPPFVRVSDARRFALDLVDELKAVGPDVNNLRLGEHTIAKTVCRHAVKANDPLQGPELEQLVRDLRSSAMPYTCPHGRPTLIELSYRDLEKRFGRLV